MKTAKQTQNFTQNRRRRFRVSLALFFSVSFALLFALPLWARAASFSFEIAPVTVVTGETFPVTLQFNADGESFNALEGVVSFPADRLELVGINDGDSIVSLWVERLKVPVGCAGTCAVKWSGVMPGGFSGTLAPSRQLLQPGQIFTLTFRAKTSGIFSLHLSGGRAFRNDGEGTEVMVRDGLLSVTVREGKRDGMPPEAPDTASPESFTLHFLRTPALFDGAWSLAWDAKDKGSGISYYAIRESTQKIEATQINTGDWITTESPYMLKDQKLRSYIYVKAVDNVGNERVVVAEPHYPLRWYEAWWIWSIIILVFIVTYLIGRILWKK